MATVDAVVVGIVALVVIVRLNHIRNHWREMRQIWSKPDGD
jgi:hypothetical protein